MLFLLIFLCGLFFASLTFKINVLTSATRDRTQELFDKNNQLFTLTHRDSDLKYVFSFNTLGVPIEKATDETKSYLYYKESDESKTALKFIALTDDLYREAYYSEGIKKFLSTYEIDTPQGTVTKRGISLVPINKDSLQTSTDPLMDQYLTYAECRLILRWICGK